MAKTHYQELVRLVKENDTEDCIVWPHHVSKSGHGEVRHPFQRRDIVASRAAFEIENGYLPPVVRHSCDNPPCINPKHLEGGDHLDNVADRVDRGRSAVGENNGRAKLDSVDAVEIFMSQDSVSRVAQAFQVDRKLIRDIKNERIWKSATERLDTGSYCVRHVHEYESDGTITVVENRTHSMF